jgi:DNA repair exonuclease SbcCD ATPase subunit
LIIRDSDDIILKNQDKIIELEKNDTELQESRNDLQNKIVELIETKQPISYEGPSIKKLENEESILIKDIEKINSNTLVLEDKINTIKSNISSYQNTINKKQFEKISIELSEIINKKDIVSNEISTLTSLIASQKKKINHLKTHEYDPTCKYCIENIFVKDALEAERLLPGNELELKSKIGSVEFFQQRIDRINSLIHEYQEKINLKNSIEKLELQLQILESDIQTKESELETNAERQELFKKNESAIIFNETINNKIDSKKKLILETTELIKNITNKIKSNHGEIEVAKTKKKTALEQLDTYKQLETEYKAYEYYLQSVKRDGVPYELIKKALPKIETEINNVLNQVVDFNMVLNTDGKNINGYIIYDEDNFWPLELTSGMERFISSLAIRVALINVSALPRPNFIAIDEGWGSLDREHISAVTNLFEYFRTKFDFSIIISHVESMRDMVDNLIEVNKINNFSQIQHT